MPRSIRPMSRAVTLEIDGEPFFSSPAPPRPRNDVCRSACSFADEPEKTGQSGGRMTP